ncbi:MAG TPA: cyclomaltodextrinase N-terminal domain-containing protein, partial [Chitinophagaceae bacterium]|nr:cyclomaltodextrinase N-terminal domain-containing protein [Chitinophagaceae bacterium]
MKHIFRLLQVVIAVLFFSGTAAQTTVYPTHWWTGMKESKLQLMVRGENISAKIPMYKLSAAGMKLAEGVTLKSIDRVENP